MEKVYYALKRHGFRAHVKIASRIVSNHKGLATADAEMVCVGKRRTWGSTAEGQGERK